jgi:hypothetical protein
MNNYSSVYDDPALIRRLERERERTAWRLVFPRRAFHAVLWLMLGAVLGMASVARGDNAQLASNDRDVVAAAAIDNAAMAGLLPFWGDQLFFDGISGDFQCQSDDGCTAIMPGEDGPQPPGGGREGAKYTKVHKFKKGDIVSTSSGWIVNPAYGWKEVD